MSNPPCQPAYEPDISAFIKWVEDHSVTGTLGPVPTVNHPFMPLPRLDTYLKEGRRTETLLRALFPNRDPPIEAQEVWRNCTKVFSILLFIGKGGFIQYFVQNDQLWDAKLPFISQADFPSTPNDDRFFDSFFKQQWRFCPHTFRPDDVRLRKECILPIVHKEQLQGGGSAITYKIKLHPAYDDLTDSRQDPGYRYANTYVLKTYRFNDAKDKYDTEVKAFRALRAGGSLGKCIIGFYGGYEQDGSYNILLEYADRGTLEQYLWRTPSPTTGDDIYKFWDAFFNVIKALKLIHNVQGGNPGDPPVLQGFHQDIKPANLLITSGRSGSNFDCEFKLADLGLSHFRKAQVSHVEAIDKDTSGTREYGAPECYRFDDFMERSHIDVKQAVDVWSLGAVFSEVAVWVVHGKDGLDNYRQMRQDETNQLRNFKDGRAFHDGETVLQSVCSMHEEVFENVRTSDHVTRSVVKKMITEMLDEVDGRPTTKQLWLKSQNILRDAKKKLRASKGMQPEANAQSQRREPPTIPPPDLPRYHQLGGLGGLERSMSLDYDRKRRSATINVLAREHTPSPEPNAVDEYETPDEMLSATPTPPTSPPDPHAGSYNKYRGSLTHGSIYQPTSPQQRSTINEPGSHHSPSHHGKARQRDSTRTSSRGLDLPQDQSLPRSLSGLSIGELDGSPVVRPQGVEPFARQVEAGDFQWQSVEKETATMNIPSPPRNECTSEVPPYTSVAKAENRILKKQHQISTLENKELLDGLRERDHVFLVDDAASMRPHWDEVSSVLHVLAYMLKGCDDDGMDLHFTISNNKYKSRNSTGIIQQIRGKELRGTSDLGSRLSTILHEYQTSLRQPAQNRLSFFGRPKAKVKKPLSVYILTDAVWQPHSDVAEPIVSVVGTLKELGFPRTQVGIQFIRFGDNLEGIKKLAYLDQGLGLPMDIVDTEPAGGNVWKMLLGAVNKWFDGDKDQVNKSKTQGI